MTGIVDRWYNEIEYISNPCDEMKGKSVSDSALHFTQMIWAKTEYIGCGLTMCPGCSTFLVCNYGEAGNMRGESVYPVNC
ncbi:Uncharacterised protein g1498 [Pycnogonum litorale]